MTAVWIALAAVAALSLITVVPRVLLRGAQDRLAQRLLEEDAGRYKLLTRGELVAGNHRRVPGVLGLAGDTLEFRSLFGEELILPTSRIQKIITGRRISSGRQLIRLEALRLTRTDGEELEFVVTPASASAWRSHLGLWAVAERKAAMDVVSPGR